MNSVRVRQNGLLPDSSCNDSLRRMRQRESRVEDQSVHVGARLKVPILERWSLFPRCCRSDETFRWSKRIGVWNQDREYGVQVAKSVVRGYSRSDRKRFPVAHCRQRNEFRRSQKSCRPQTRFIAMKAPNLAAIRQIEANVLVPKEPKGIPSPLPSAWVIARVRACRHFDDEARLIFPYLRRSHRDTSSDELNPQEGWLEKPP